MLFVAVAAAHPGSGSSTGSARDVIGHRLEVAIERDAVQVTYVAEVPERRVLADARDETNYGQQLLSLLSGNVALTWNGALLVGTPQPLEDSVTAGENNFLDFRLRWRAPLPAVAGRLGVRNGNYPSEPGFFATSVTLDGSRMADATSLLTVKSGRIRDNWHGAWVRDEKAREPWVDVRPAGFLERSAGPEPLPRRMVGLAREGLAWWAYVLGGMGLVPIALLGRWMGARARRPLP